MSGMPLLLAGKRARWRGSQMQEASFSGRSIRSFFTEALKALVKAKPKAKSKGKTAKRKKRSG